MPGPLDHRLLFVTGKGGVGKSTVSTVLGMLAARQGLRTIVAELASQEHVQRAFEQDGERFSEVELAPDLYTISIDPQAAMEEYLTVKTGTLGQVLGSSKMFNAFAMATPGMRELLSMGKVWELAQLERQTSGAAPYDFVVVDAPATGHGVGILRTPKMFSEIAMVGPIARQGSRIATTIADPAFTGIVAVATPEEMAVNETLALRDALDRDGLTLELVVVNALYAERFDDGEVAELDAAAAKTRSPLVRSALKAALSEHARVAMQSAQYQRLCDELDVPIVRLPYVFADHLGLEELEGLADELEAALLRCGRPSSAERHRGLAGAQPGLDRAVDESRPPVGDVGARQQHAALGALHRRVVVLVPAGAVDRPGAAREAVGQPVVGGCGEHLIAREDLVELTLHRRQITGVAARCVDAEADQQLRPILEHRLRVEVAERVAGTNRVLQHRLAPGVDEDLDPARGLAERDRGALLLGQRRRELDRAERVQRNRDDGAAQRTRRRRPYRSRRGRRSASPPPPRLPSAVRTGPRRQSTRAARRSPARSSRDRR